MRNAQLSVTIIVGLVVVIMAGVGYYVFSSIERPSAAEVQIGREIVQPIKQYVDGCVRVGASAALDMLGKQGGVIYASQGGLSSDDAQNDAVLFDRHYVLYAVDVPRGEVKAADGSVLFSSVAEAYPWPLFPCLNAQCVESEKLFTGYFGIERVPAVNGTALSIENQLAAAVSKSVDACLDWSKFAYLPVDILSSPSQVSVFLNPSDTTFLVNASIFVRKKDGSGEGALSSSTLKVPLRLKALATAARAALGKDASDITYEPSSYAGDGITATYTQDVANVMGDDLITFTDTRSKLDGVPYELRFARRNRLPALGYVIAPNPREINLCTGMSIKHVYDPATNENHLLFETPEGLECSRTYAGRWPPFGKEIQVFDPDGDPVLTKIYAPCANQIVARDPLTESGGCLVDVAHGTGVIQLRIDVHEQSSSSTTAQDFQTLNVPSSGQVIEG